MPVYQEERQPAEWEVLLPSMDLRPACEVPSSAHLSYEADHAAGYRRLNGARSPVAYRCDEAADPAQHDEEPPPQPWEREDAELFVRRLLRLVDELEADVVRMRWGIGQPEHTQAEICEALDIVRATSYNAERRAFRRMRTVLGILDQDEPALAPVLAAPRRGLAPGAKSRTAKALPAQVAAAQAAVRTASAA